MQAGSLIADYAISQRSTCYVRNGNKRGRQDCDRTLLPCPSHLLWEWENLHRFSSFNSTWRFVRWRLASCWVLSKRHDTCIPWCHVNHELRLHKRWIRQTTLTFKDEMVEYKAKSSAVWMNHFYHCEWSNAHRFTGLQEWRLSTKFSRLKQPNMVQITKHTAFTYEQLCWLQYILYNFHLYC